MCKNNGKCQHGTRAQRGGLDGICRDAKLPLRVWSGHCLLVGDQFLGAKLKGLVRQKDKGYNPKPLFREAGNGTN